jgi:glycosyltransferase involved in cell wall biosynthesis
VAAKQPVAGRLPLTVIIPALNEAENLPAALASVAWADELIVVDSQSTDETARVASAAGAAVVQFSWEPGRPRKKAWALANLEPRNDWVFILDADERVPDVLRDEIAAAIESDDVDGWYVDRELVFMGRRLHCFNPNWNLRLFRRGRARVEDLGLDELAGTGDVEVHEHVIVEGRRDFLHARLLHDDYRGLTPWLDRHNRYATWEAHLYRRFRTEPIGVGVMGFLALNPLERKRVLRRVWVRLPCRPLLRFFVWFVLRRGFLDGRAGFTFCVLMAHYEFIIGAKMREISLIEGEPGRATSGRPWNEVA